MSMTIDLSSYAVRVNGSIDERATVAKFTSDLATFAAREAEENGTISEAVHALFDKYPGARLSTDYIKGEVLRGLNVQPENFKALSTKIVGFLKAQCSGDDSVFVTGVGRGGGVARRADLPAK